MYDYKKQQKWAKLRVGLVITFALAVIFLAVMFAGSIERIFAPRTTIHAVFDDVKGLREGSPVWFSGVEIGSVSSIKFTLKQNIKVGMSIISSYLGYLKTDSKADILTLGLLGDKYIEITTGTPDAENLKPGETIEGITHIEIQDVVETGQESIQSLSGFINMLEEIIGKIERGEGTIPKFLKDPSVYNNLQNATNELTVLLKKIKSGKGSISRLLNEDKLYSDIASSAESVEGFSKKLQSSEGTLNKLIEDESLYKNINNVSEKLDSLLAKINKGEGFVGSLMKDDELSEEIKTTLKELNLLIKDIKENPGKYFKFSLF